MSRLTDRLERDLRQIAERAAPSTDAWSSILDRIDAAPAEREMEIVMLSPERNRPVASRRRLLLAGAAVLVLALAVGLVLVPRGDSDDLQDPVETTLPPPASTVPATTAPPTTIAPEDWSPEASPPGRFRTTLLEPGLIVTLGEGWTTGQPQTRLSWEAFRRDDPVPPEEAVSLHVFREFEAVTADEVVERARSQGFQLAAEVPVEVGGIPGRRYEIDGGAGFLVQLEFSEFGLDDAQTPGRFTVLEIDDAVMVVVELAGPEADVDLARAITQEAVDTIEWVRSGIESTVDDGAG